MDKLLAIRLFLHIASTGTFTKASAAVQIPRSTASQVISRLESHLGASLLHRTTRRVRLTAQGEAFLAGAADLMSQLEAMDRHVKDAGASARGVLRVDVGSALARAIVIPALPSFHARHPGIKIKLGISDRVVDLVHEGVDCVIRGGELADAALVARRIAELDWVTCASPSYLDSRGVPRHPAELHGADAVAGGTAEAPHALVGTFSKRSGRRWPLAFRRGAESVVIDRPFALCVNETSTQLHALLSGAGIGQCLRVVAAPHLQTGALREVLGEWSRPRYPVHLVHPGGRHASAKLRHFMAWAAEVFERHDRRPRRAAA
ncbi:LysR family transcriptional regulator [Mitsuaria sp. GD03876]|uniref:LysR family transcriptional regulator n=1 Tax=Mitsuaria sp. GD03876 TaxID=2975399 RepID=UPI002449F23C|nr:LysR family transcriptional regulator [Mitsuaria sp. GD03876]MDH0864458.1 LysR substrate-binding domain-containing protein [Mitsuaria sp. GD03876]